MVNKTDKPLGRLRHPPKKKLFLKVEEMQIIKIKNDRWDIATYHAGGKRVLRETMNSGMPTN